MYPPPNVGVFIKQSADALVPVACCCLFTYSSPPCPLPSLLFLPSSSFTHTTCLCSVLIHSSTALTSTTLFYEATQPDSATLPSHHFSPPSPVLPSVTMASKKTRCGAKECRERAQAIVGDCSFCQGHFCGRHRLLEDHKCSGLEDVSPANPSYVQCEEPLETNTSLEQCKKQSHARNAAQLESERTQVIRGV